MNNSASAGSIAAKSDPPLQELIEEFAARLERGEQLQIEEFVLQHPEHADQLRVLLPTMQALAEWGKSSLDIGGEAPDSAVSDEQPVVGTLGDYRIIQEVGRGGMGVVYKAEQISLGRMVALKVLPFAATLDPRQLLRFQNEARAAASLDHPHIVKVHAVGCERGVHYYAMQFVEGQSLDALIQQMRPDQQESQHGADPQQTADQDNQPNKPREHVLAADTRREPQTAVSTLLSQLNKREYFRRIAELGIQAGEALEHAHQSGVIHRDIKPANLMLDGRGNLWITDFGLAHFQTDAKLTMTGDLVGTIRYMSPEQALAKRIVVDQRTDIYSMGATLYELITLKPVFSGKDRQELLRQIAFEEPVSPRRVDKHVPFELETIVLKCLEKNPEDRYSIGKELAEDLTRFLKDEPTQARRPTLWRRARKWSRRHVAAVRATAAAAFIVLLAVAGFGGWWLNDQARREAVTEQAVSAALDESYIWQQERKTPEALGAAKRAAATIASGASTSALQARVQERLADLTLVSNLEKISATKATTLQTLPKLRLALTSSEETDREYAAAFLAYGLDMKLVSSEEAGSHFRGRTVAMEVAEALDDWAAVVSSLKAPEKGRSQRLVALARQVDPDPWRCKLRDAVEAGDAVALDGLLASVQLDQISPLSVTALASGLRRIGRSEDVVELLTKAHDRFPNDYWINYNLAWALTDQKPPQYDEAIRYLTVAVALRPRSAAAHFYLANALLAKGRNDVAITSFRSALRLQPDFVAGYNNLAVALTRKGEFSEAIAVANTGIRLDPKHASLHLNLGAAFWDQGELTAAIDAYTEAKRLDPDDKHVHFNLGLVYDKQKRVDDAIKAYQQAIRCESYYADAHLNLGTAYSKIGEWDKALAAFDNCLEYAPNDAIAHDNRGNMLERKGQLDEAIDSRMKAISIDPNYANAHCHLGGTLVLQKKFDEGLKAIHKAIELKADYADAHYNLGFAMRHQRKWDEAITAFQEAIRLNEEYAEAYEGLGVALAETNQLDKAIVALRNATKYGPHLAHSFESLGMALNQAKRWDEAIPALRKALELDIEKANSHSGLGVALLNKGELNAAIASFTEAVRLDPTTFGFKLNLGIAYNQLGERQYHKGLKEHAVDSFSKAVAANPQDKGARWNLTVVLRELERLEEAVDGLRTFLSFHPNTAHAHNSLAWIFGTAADPKFRDPKAALEEAQTAVKLEPKEAGFWNTLGVARYRNGDWSGAVEAVGKSMELAKFGDACDYFVLAMSHWQLGDKDQARTSYDKGVDWMEKKEPNNAEFRRFRVEAAVLLMIDFSKKLKDYE